MAPRLRKMLEQQLRLGYNNPDEKWREVFVGVVGKFRLDDEEKMIDLLYIQHRSKYNVMRKLNMTDDNYYYALRKILNYTLSLAKYLKVM